MANTIVTNAGFDFVFTALGDQFAGNGPAFPVKYFLLVYDERTDPEIHSGKPPDNIGDTGVLVFDGVTAPTDTSPIETGGHVILNQEGYTISDREILIASSGDSIDPSNILSGSTKDNISTVNLFTSAGELFALDDTIFPGVNPIIPLSASEFNLGGSDFEISAGIGSDLAYFDPTNKTLAYLGPLLFPVRAFIPITVDPPGGVRSIRGLFKCRLDEFDGDFKFNKIALYTTQFQVSGSELIETGPLELFAMAGLNEPVLKRDDGFNLANIDIDVEVEFASSGISDVFFDTTDSWFKVPNVTSGGDVTPLSAGLFFDGEVSIGSSGLGWVPETKLKITAPDKTHLRLATDADNLTPLGDRNYVDIRMLTDNKLIINPNANTGINDPSIFNVGIGTLAPIHRLEIRNTVDTDIGIAKAGVKDFGFVVRGTGTADSRFYFSDFSNLKDRATINDSGFLGIGANIQVGGSNPSHLLHIQANSGNTEFAIDTAGATDNSRVIFKRQNSERWAIDYDGTTDNLRFQYGGIDRATFLTSGYLGLNTTAPSQIVSRFTLYGLNVSEEVRWVRDAGAFGTNEGIIRSDSNNFIIDTTGQLGAKTDLSLRTHGTIRIYISQVLGGFVAVGNNLISPETRLHVQDIITIAEPVGSFAKYGVTTDINPGLDNIRTRQFIVRSNTSGGVTSTFSNTSLVDGISVNASYDTPTTTRTWVERDPGLAGVANDACIKFGDATTEFLRMCLIGGVASTSITTGNFGVGTSTPSDAIHLFSSTGSTILKIETDFAGGQASIDMLGNATLDGDVFHTLFFRNTTGGHIARIEVQRGSTGSAGDMLFYTSTGAGTLERMRIDQDGNVGVGTNIPITILDVVGISGVRITDGSNGVLRILPDSSGVRIELDKLTGGTRDFRFLDITNGESMRITSTGNVGIGSSSPGILTNTESGFAFWDTSGTILDIEELGSGLNNAVLNFVGDPDVTNTAYGMIAFTHFGGLAGRHRTVAHITALRTASGGSDTEGAFLRFNVKEDGSSNTHDMVWSNTGRLGVDEFSPSVTLDVAGDITTTSGKINFSSSDTSGAKIEFSSGFFNFLNGGSAEGSLHETIGIDSLFSTAATNLSTLGGNSIAVKDKGYFGGNVGINTLTPDNTNGIAWGALDKGIKIFAPGQVGGNARLVLETSGKSIIDLIDTTVSNEGWLEITLDNGLSYIKANDDTNTTIHNFFIMRHLNGFVGMAPGSQFGHLPTSLLHLKDVTATNDTTITIGADGASGFFTVSGTANVNSHAGVTSDAVKLIGSANSGGMLFSNNEANPIIFGTTDIERMRIDGSGLVGINTLFANTRLDVDEPSLSLSLLSAVSCFYSADKTLYKTLRIRGGGTNDSGGIIHFGNSTIGNVIVGQIDETVLTLRGIGGVVIDTAAITGNDIDLCAGGDINLSPISGAINLTATSANITLTSPDIILTPSNSPVGMVMDSNTIDFFSITSMSYEAFGATTRFIIRKNINTTDIARLTLLSHPTSGIGVLDFTDDSSFSTTQGAIQYSHSDNKMSFFTGGGTFMTLSSIGTLDVKKYSVNGAAGANFSGVVTNITVVDGLVTAVS